MDYVLYRDRQWVSGISALFVDVGSIRASRPRRHRIKMSLVSTVKYLLIIFNDAFVSEQDVALW